MEGSVGQVWCEKPSNCQSEYIQHGGLTRLQIDQADAEAGAVTAGLLGATSCPPVGGVYQGGLSPSLRGMSPETPESMFIWEGPGSIFDPRTKSQC